MAVTQYKDVSWVNGEPLDVDKLNAMVTNSRYLFEHAPRVYYAAYDKSRELYMGFLCGTVVVPKTSENVMTVSVDFGSFFQSGSKPIIATSLQSPYNRGVVETIYGKSGVGYVPDNRGFKSTVVCRELDPKKNFIAQPMFLHWLAMGWMTPPA